MIEEEIVIHLPWPPTVNSYYKSSRSGGRYLDKSVTEYRQAVEESLHEQCPGLHLDYPLFVEVHLFPPDRRKRDLDNYMKGLLDALTNAELWEDDSLIDQLCIYRGNTAPKGAVIVTITAGGPLLSLA